MYFGYFEKVGDILTDIFLSLSFGILVFFFFFFLLCSLYPYDA